MLVLSVGFGIYSLARLNFFFVGLFSSDVIGSVPLVPRDKSL